MTARDALAKAYERRVKDFNEAKQAMRNAWSALKLHDVLNSGYHNKIVKTSVYPNGIIVTDDILFHDDGAVKRIAGAILRKDGTPGLRVGAIWPHPSLKMEISDIPVTGRMYYNGEAVFDFAFTSGVSADNLGAFSFVTTAGRYGSYSEQRVSIDGQLINQVATWQFVSIQA